MSTEQNGSYLIRQNNIKQKNVVRLLFSHKTKDFGQPNIRVVILDLNLTRMNILVEYIADRKNHDSIEIMGYIWLCVCP